MWLAAGLVDVGWSLATICPIDNWRPEMVLLSTPSIRAYRREALSTIRATSKVELADKALHFTGHENDFRPLSDSEGQKRK